MKRGIVLLTALVSLLAVASPAEARTFGDPDDVAGKLDLQWVSFYQPGSGDRTTLQFRATTYDDWTIRQCLHAATLEDGCSLKFVLDTAGPTAWRPSGRGVDYALVWHPKSCVLIEPASQHVAGVGIAAKDGRTVTCSIRRNKLTVHKKIRWYVSTTWATLQTQSYANDLSPNTGWHGLAT
jgi:hypothetical protein